MSKDWNWHSSDAEDSMVIPSVQAVAVYTNGNGDVVIRQEGWAGEDDSVIVIPVSLAQQVADAIKNELS